MIQSGLARIWPKSTDFDFHKSYGSASSPTLPDSYSVSQNWFPNQNATDESFTPAVAALPYGCTEVTPCVVCGDEDGVRYRADYLESALHANANGGGDIRTALSWITKNGMKAADGTISKNHAAYFSVRPSGVLDWFDAVRLAMYSTESENRAVVIGSNFFSDWLTPGFLRMPTNLDPKSAPLHCWSVEGWVTYQNEPYLSCNMLLGPVAETPNVSGYGPAYMSRDIFNAIMGLKMNGVSFTAAFTVEKNLPSTVQTVDLNVVDRIVGFIRSLLGLQ